MKRVLGHNRARPARRGQSIERRPLVRYSIPKPPPRLVHGKLPSLPWHPSRGRSRPPRQAQSGQSRPSASSRLLALLPASAQCSACLARCCSPHHPFTVGCRHTHISPNEGLAGWNIPTPPSTVTSNPPSLTFLKPSIHQRLAARTFAAPIRIETCRQQLAAARSNPLQRHRYPASIDTPGLAAGLVRASGSGGPERAQPQLACVVALEPYQVVIVSNLAPVNPAVLAWLLLSQSNRWIPEPFLLVCPVP